VKKKSIKWSTALVMLALLMDGFWIFESVGHLFTIHDIVTMTGGDFHPIKSMSVFTQIAFIGTLMGLLTKIMLIPLLGALHSSIPTSADDELRRMKEVQQTNAARVRVVMLLLFTTSLFNSLFRVDTAYAAAAFAWIATETRATDTIRPYLAVFVLCVSLGTDVIWMFHGDTQMLWGQLTMLMNGELMSDNLSADGIAILLTVLSAALRLLGIVLLVVLRFSILPTPPPKLPTRCSSSLLSFLSALMVIASFASSVERFDGVLAVALIGLLIGQSRVGKRTLSIYMLMLVLNVAMSVVWLLWLSPRKWKAIVLEMDWHAFIDKIGLWGKLEIGVALLNSLLSILQLLLALCMLPHCPSKMQDTEFS